MELGTRCLLTIDDILTAIPQIITELQASDLRSMLDDGTEVMLDSATERLLHGGKLFADRPKLLEGYEEKYLETCERVSKALIEAGLYEHYAVLVANEMDVRGTLWRRSKSRELNVLGDMLKRTEEVQKAIHKKVRPEREVRLLDHESRLLETLFNEEGDKEWGNKLYETMKTKVTIEKDAPAMCQYILAKRAQQMYGVTDDIEWLKKSFLHWGEFIKRRKREVFGDKMYELNKEEELKIFRDRMKHAGIAHEMYRRTKIPLWAQIRTCIAMKGVGIVKEGRYIEGERLRGIYKGISENTKEDVKDAREKWKSSKNNEDRSIYQIVGYIAYWVFEQQGYFEKERCLELAGDAFRRAAALAQGIRSEIKEPEWTKRAISAYIRARDCYKDCEKFALAKQMDKRSNDLNNEWLRSKKK